VNIGVTALEELSDADESAEAQVPKMREAAESPEPYRGQDSLPKSSLRKPASANQLATIGKLARLLGRAEVPDEGMTAAEASDRIADLSREYNGRKGQDGRRSA
jgi:hypothetical protein